MEARVEGEDSRVHHYLDPRTAPALQRTLEDNLLTPHLSTVISLPNSGLDNMIDTEKTDDLARLYRLFTSVPTGLPCLKKHLKECIVRRGKEINKASLGDDMSNADLDVEGEDEESTRRKGSGKDRLLQNSPAQKLALALKWVQDVLDLRDQFFDGVWKAAFKGDREVESTLNEVTISSLWTESMLICILRLSSPSSTLMSVLPSTLHYS